MDSPRWLTFVRSLALPSGLAAASACGTSAPPPANPPTATSASASSTPSSSVVANVVDHEPPPDPTAGSGPCRCSWDTKQAAAPRVCKKGESSYEGKVCQVTHSKYPKYPIKVGPLDPPDLA